MDHVVYLDYKADELNKLLSGTKTMIIRGAAGRKLPYGRVFKNDMLYLINNTGDRLIRARSKVKDVIQSEKMTGEESIKFLDNYKGKGLLDLADSQIKRWSGKRYMVIIELGKIENLKPFEINRSNYGNMDDWLPVEDIDNVKE